METRITYNPEIFNGKAIIRGMRISVSMVLDLLGEGMSWEQILHEYPVLEAEDIAACLKYAGAITDHERTETMSFGE